MRGEQPRDPGRRLEVGQILERDRALERDERVRGDLPDYLEGATLVVGV